jgi:hypothetical protein
MKEPKVILLNPTSAIVTYEVRFKISPTDGKNADYTVYHNTAAWAKRHGKWWAVFCESMLIEEDKVFKNVFPGVTDVYPAEIPFVKVKRREPTPPKN